MFSLVEDSKVAVISVLFEDFFRGFDSWGEVVEVINVG